MQTRPIATARVLRNVVYFKEATDFYRAFPYCGYSFSDGPWVDTLIAFNLDPRRDPQYRIYQTIAFDDTYDPVILLGSTQVSPHFGKKSDKRSHIFDGKLIVPDSKIWQFWDIVDDQLQRILSTTEIRHDLCAKNGFFHIGTIAKLQIIMNDKIICLRDGLLPVNEDYECLLAIPDTYQHQPNDRLRYGLKFGEQYTRKQAFLRSLILDAMR
jgi:general transcription factor 3C polypeptide 5 (transcription factor C subunit 1)